jgi:hypothetical protein
MNVFIFQDWPSRDEVEWTNRFATALRLDGFDVFQEWTLPKPASQEAVEAALRDADAIVVLVLAPTSLDSPALYFTAGVATFGGKGVVTVVSRSLTSTDIPLALLRERVVSKTSAERTAHAVAAELKAIERRRVA